MAAQPICPSSLNTPFDLKQAPIDPQIPVSQSKTLQMSEDKILIASSHESLQSSAPCSSLWDAIEIGNLELVQKQVKKWWFWEVRQRINTKNAEGLTPLLAVQHGHSAIVSYLLQNKAHPHLCDSLGYQPLHWAAKKGSASIASELLKAGADVNARGEYERTPLHMAAHNGKEELTTLLLQSGALINAQASADDNFTTPLHEAVLREHLPIVQILTQNPHLNINLLDSKSLSPLYYAVSLGLVDIATLLVSHPSWKNPSNPQNPNHTSQLIKRTPPQNALKMKQLLEHLS